MQEPIDPRVSRREVLAGGIATLGGMMLAAMAADAGALTRAYRTDPRYRLADRLAELVIPALPGSPGAAAARTAEFVLLALDHRMGSLSTAMLEQVLAALDAAGPARFLTLSASQQADRLAALDADAFGIAEPAPETLAAAWRGLKTAIVAGYYTSEIGASRELVYEPVPGKFRNISLDPTFRSRSNDGFNSGFGGRY